MADGFERLVELTIKVSGFDPRVDGTPVKSVGWPEIASAMATLDQEQSDILRALYLHEESAAWRVRKSVERQLARWPDLPPMLHRAFVDGIIGAFIAMRPCRKCGGAGYLSIPARSYLDSETMEWKREKAYRVECAVCAGDGFDHINAAAVQLTTGVSAEVWIEKLATPFGVAYAYLRETHDTARAALQDKMG
jgi:hypothetical protein